MTRKQLRKSSRKATVRKAKAIKRSARKAARVTPQQAAPQTAPAATPAPVQAGPQLTSRQLAARKAAETKARDKATAAALESGRLPASPNFRYTTLRPGLLVALNTSVSGNVRYTRVDLGNETTADGARVAKWETERTIIDPVEYEAATRVRTQAGAIIRRVCVQSAFGLLCPEDREAELNAAFVEADQVARDFNKTANITRVRVHHFAGRVAADNVQAVKAINAEVRDLLAEVQTGLSNLDAKAVREAAKRVRSLGGMLSPEAQARIQLAIDVARTAATRIVAAGSNAAMEIDRATIARVEESRTAFLDLDDVAEVAAPSQDGRAVDFVEASPTVAPVAAPSAAAVPQLDM